MYNSIKLEWQKLCNEGRNMKQDREKEIHRLMYFYNEIIKEKKKALKELRKELEILEHKKSNTRVRKRKL